MVLLSYAALFAGLNNFASEAQALSKLSRGYNRDIDDVLAMYKQKLFTLEKRRDCFDAIVKRCLGRSNLN
jgi:hypothetical protein